MAAKTWSNVSEETGYILGIDSNAAFVLTFDRAKPTIVQDIAKRLADGADPISIGASEAKVISFSQLRRIQVTEMWPTVKLFYVDPVNESKERNATYKSKTGQFKQRQDVAREIADATGRKVRESFVNVSLFSALFAPAVFSILVTLLGWGVYSTAAGVEAGKEIVANGGKNRGIEQILIWIATTLGTNTTLMIGSVCLTGCLLLAIRLIVKRPQILQIDFDNSQA